MSHRIHVRHATFVDSATNDNMTWSLYPPVWVPTGGSVEIDGWTLTVRDGDDRVITIYKYSPTEPKVYRLADARKDHNR